MSQVPREYRINYKEDYSNEKFSIEKFSISNEKFYMDNQGEHKEIMKSVSEVYDKISAIPPIKENMDYILKRLDALNEHTIKISDHDSYIKSHKEAHDDLDKEIDEKYKLLCEKIDDLSSAEKSHGNDVKDILKIIFATVLSTFVTIGILVVTHVIKGP